MEAENEPLDELADAVLEGHPVDWASAESSAGAPDREAVRQLRILAGIAGLHRKLAQDTPISTQPGGPGDALGHWGRLEILERIGQGSFGEVYRAWDSKLDREVAVKLLHAGQAQPEGAAVLKEARLLARVRHPNVVIVYDADEFEGRVGLWMEFVHGHNLEQILGERQRFDAREVTRVGIELCRALAAVHDAGLLHRDIKAQNVMQTADGRLVLMDFGTGRDLEGASAPTVDAAGTPLYLAPEIFSGGQATVRTDIYSAGVLLFHLLTGAYPVRGATVKEVGLAHETGERLDLAARAPGASRTLVAAIGRAIEPDPSRRFESARDMLAALEKVLWKTETRARKRVFLAIAAATLIAIALGVASGLRRRNQDRDPKSGAPRAAYLGLTPEKRAVQVPRALLTGTPSPDGRYIPYSESGTGNLAIYEFATGDSRVLTKGGDGGDRYATESVVSADSRQIAYCWIDGSSNAVQLRVIDTEGGSPRVLSSDSNPTSIEPLEWSPDGRQILGTRQRSTGETEVLLIAAADGAVQVIRTQSHVPGRVTLSPDGRYIAYDRAEDSDDRDRGIYLLPTDGGEEIPVVTGPTYDSHPMWTPDGSGLVFASTRTGGPDLWLQGIKDGRPDGQPRLLDKDMGAFAPITLTRGGSLFYRHRTGLMDVYTAPINPVTGDVEGAPRVVAKSFLGSNLAADWSPDGSTLVFASWRTLFGPGRNILVFHSMGTGLERELAPDLAFVNAPRWSPDGRLIAVGGADRKGVNALRLLDPESGRVVSTLFPQSGDAPAIGAFVWASDGRHIYLKHNGQQGVARFDTGTGEEELLYQPPSDSVLGGLPISPDGRWLASTLHAPNDKNFHVIAISTGGGPSRDLAKMPGPGPVAVAGWTRDGGQILFTRRKPDSQPKQIMELWAIPFTAGSPRSLGLSMHALRDVRVSPDGSHISFTTGYPDQDIWVFENFLPPAK